MHILLGMLSKSKGQILRVAASLHVLFHRNTPLNVPESISEEAIKAAVTFVELCIQHAAYMAGRGDISEAIQAIRPGVLQWLNVYYKGLGLQSYRKILYTNKMYIHYIHVHFIPHTNDTYVSLLSYQCRQGAYTNLEWEGTWQCYLLLAVARQSALP